MWASSRLGDSPCFHIDTSDRERRERDSMEFECRNVQTFPVVCLAFPSFVRSFVRSFIPSFSRSLLGSRGLVTRTSPNESGMLLPGQKTVQFLKSVYS